MYHDFSQSPKDQLHGRGFSLLTLPIQDVSNRDILIKILMLFCMEMVISMEIKEMLFMSH